MIKFGTQVSISPVVGKPKASFEFFDLPSWNQLLTMNYRKKGNLFSLMRTDAYHKGRDFMEQQDDIGFGEYLVNRALVHVKVFTPKEEISDIHNVCLKAVFDGFSDAGIWADDEWAHLPLVIIQWGGHDEDVQYRIPKVKQRKKGGRMVKTKKRMMRRTRIDIHELDLLMVAGYSQRLPMGREWL